MIPGRHARQAATATGPPPAHGSTPGFAGTLARLAVAALTGSRRGAGSGAWAGGKIAVCVCPSAVPDHGPGLWLAGPAGPQSGVRVHGPDADLRRSASAGGDTPVHRSVQSGSRQEWTD